MYLVIFSTRGTSKRHLKLIAFTLMRRLTDIQFYNVDFQHTDFVLYNYFFVTHFSLAIYFLGNLFTNWKRILFLHFFLDFWELVSDILFKFRNRNAHRPTEHGINCLQTEWIFFLKHTFTQFFSSNVSLLCTYTSDILLTFFPIPKRDVVWLCEHFVWLYIRSEI